MQQAVLLLVGALALATLLGFALGFGLGRLSAGRARDRFAALAHEALRDNTEAFLALAGERFQRLEEGSESDWENRRKALDDSVGPLREALDRYRNEAQKLERDRSDTTGQLKSQLALLHEQTTRLNSALSGTAAQGRWGEFTLRRTAELAGLSEHCDFAEQVSLGASGGRPDMVVRLPGGGDVVVDAKTPLDAYLAAAEAPDETTRKSSLSDHARQVRHHVDSLAKRNYAEHIEGSPDFVVLFLPDDGFLAAAVRHDKSLAEHALTKGVVLATPATLYALLGAVARGWRDVRLSEGTREVLQHARELDERLSTFGEHLSKLGNHLGKAVETFNKAVGSLETRVLPQARRLRELGTSRTPELQPPDRIALAVRTPQPTPQEEPDRASTAE